LIVRLVVVRRDLHIIGSSARANPGGTGSPAAPEAASISANAEEAKEGGARYALQCPRDGDSNMDACDLRRSEGAVPIPQPFNLAVEVLRADPSSPNALRDRGGCMTIRAIGGGESLADASPEGKRPVDDWNSGASEEKANQGSH
jgi:hypothetical protein